MINKRIIAYIILVVFLISSLIPPYPALAQGSEEQETEEAAPEQTPPVVISTAATLPTFVALAPNINEFGRFADSGPDAGWYIGFNNAWIVQIPPAPLGDYMRTFIGAKIGRAKTRPKLHRPAEREVIKGKVYMAISQTPSFTAEQSFFLVETPDMPLEPDMDTYVPGTGPSEWFWAEVPPALVSFKSSNYLILWSPTEYFLSTGSAPIVAAYDVSSNSKNFDPRVWNNRSIHGVPPRRVEGALETPIHNLYPAMAIKLVPPNTHRVEIKEFSVRSISRDYLLAQFSATSTDLEFAWLEASQEQLDWERTSRYMRKPPFLFTVSMDRISPRGTYIRAAARDALGNISSSESVLVNP